jgi:DNA invertase Pin-like site-specific DNA recombinase
VLKSAAAARTPGVSRTKKSASNPKVAIGYCRASTSDQSNGLQAQRDAIDRWASTHGVTIVAWFFDEGVSGGARLDERLGLMDALAALKTHNAGKLLCARRDRVARDVSIAAAIEKLCREASAAVVTADGIDASDSPEAALVRTILDAMSAYERALIRARTRAALRVKKSRGELVGSVPFGFTANDQRKLVPCAGEQAALQRMRELAAQGRSQPEICRALTAEGHRPRGKQWNITTVSRALRRAA